MNNYSNESTINDFKEHITSLGSYNNMDMQNIIRTPQGKNDYLMGYFINENGLFQIDKMILKVDFNHDEFRAIDASQENELLPYLISGENHDGIQVARFSEYENEANFRLNNWGSCLYCLAGGVAVGFGCPAGLLELWACIDCYNANT